MSLIRPKAFNFIDTQITQNLTISGTQVFVPPAAIAGVSFLANEHTYFVLQDVNQNREIVRVTGTGPGLLTISHRGQDGTVARDFPVGSRIYNAPVAAYWADILAAAIAANNFGGSGAVVGLAYTAGSAFDALPEGTRQLFHQAALPPGWDIDLSFTDHSLRVVSSGGGTTGGTVPFSTLFNRTSTDHHALTQAEIPNYTLPHSLWIDMFVDGDASSGVTSRDWTLDDEGEGWGRTLIAGTIWSGGAGWGHNHTMDMRVLHANVLMGVKNNV